MDKLRKSFKSMSEQTTHSSEELRILLQQQQDDLMSGSDHRKEVVLDIRASPRRETELSSRPNAPAAAESNGVLPIWRDSSYDFSNDVKNAGGGRGFDFDVVDSPLSEGSRSGLSKIMESPRVSFKESTTEPVPRRSNVSAAVDGEVLECSANSSFRRKSSLLSRTRTKSRLMDPPEHDRRSQNQNQNQRPISNKSGMLRSGLIGRASEIDEDDPFMDTDLPEEYKKMKFNKLSVVQLVSLLLIIGALCSTLAIKKLRKMRLYELDIWKWELMVLVLISGRLVSGWVIRIIVFFIERNFLLRKRVLYFVYGVRNAVQNCLWLGLVLIAWQCIFDERVERLAKGKVLPYITKIWVCLLVGTIIWLLKTLIVKSLASSFHVSTFFDRIQESLFNQYVIETLSGPPLIEIQQEQEEEERVMAEVEKLQNAGATIPADLKASVFPKSGKVIGSGRETKSPKSAKSPRFTADAANKLDDGISIDHLHRLNQKNVSAWNMKKLMNIVRKGAFSTLDERIHGSGQADEAAVEITSEKQAKAASKKIFYNVAKPGSKFIYLEDLMRFLREDEASKAMQLFEGATESNGISKVSLKNWVVNAFRERRALALSLNDTKTAVNKLHHMMNAAVGVIILVIWLLILKIATTHFFVFLGSQLLLVVFMFGNTCKTTFEAIIFLFVMHPFDVGDRCEIDGIQMVVEEMNILTTVFLRFDNQKIFYPNSVLSTKPIHNYYRSPDMGDAIDFCVHVSTSTEKIALMKERILSYIDNKNEHWQPGAMIVVRDVEDLNRMKFSVWPTHTMNHQDMGERWKRRALLVEEMIKILRELDIEYRMLPLDVSIRNMPAVTSTRVPSNWTN